MVRGGDQTAWNHERPRSLKKNPAVLLRHPAQAHVPEDTSILRCLVPNYSCVAAEVTRLCQSISHQAGADPQHVEKRSPPEDFAKRMEYGRLLPLFQSPSDRRSSFSNGEIGPKICSLGISLSCLRTVENRGHIIPD